MSIEYNVGESCQGGTTSPRIPVQTEDPLFVSELPTGLLPATRYEYCLIAGNAFGETFGNSLIFQTGGQRSVSPHALGIARG